MATQLTQSDLRTFARLGAERRLEEIRREEAAIRAAFPGIGTRAPAKKAPKSAAPAKRQRRPMSKAEKKAVSDRMKKYWAERKKAR